MTNIDERHRVLLERVDELEITVSALKERLRGAEPLSGGVVEFYISELIGGKLTMGLAPYDIVASDGTFIEVKFSRLGMPNKASDSRRWSWGHPLGEGGAKLFDRLILAGEVDESYRDRYADPSAPYVLFDVPYDDVVSIQRVLPIIQITTRPDSGWSPAKTRLFREFAVTPTDLVNRYGALHNV